MAIAVPCAGVRVCAKDALYSLVNLHIPPTRLAATAASSTTKIARLLTKLPRQSRFTPASQYPACFEVTHGGVRTKSAEALRMCAFARLVPALATRRGRQRAFRIDPVNTERFDAYVCPMR